MNTNEGNNFLWNIFIGITSIAGLINIGKVLRKPKEIIDLEEIIAKQEELLLLKDETIKSLNDTLVKYKNERS